MYFCFDHGIGYGEDGFMCPECEREICETHDKQLPVNSFNASKPTAWTELSTGRQVFTEATNTDTFEHRPFVGRTCQADEIDRIIPTHI